MVEKELFINEMIRNIYRSKEKCIRKYRLIVFGFVPCARSKVNIVR